MKELLFVLAIVAYAAGQIFIGLVERRCRRDDEVPIWVKYP